MKFYYEKSRLRALAPLLLAGACMAAGTGCAVEAGSDEELLSEVGQVSQELTSEGLTKVVTAFPAVDASWTFAVHPNDYSLLAIHQSGTTSGFVETQTISGGTYSSVGPVTVTPIPALTDNAWRFSLDFYGVLTGLHTGNTSSGKVEGFRLDGATLSSFVTSLPASSDPQDWDFIGVEPGGTWAIQKNMTASGKIELHRLSTYDGKTLSKMVTNVPVNSGTYEFAVKAAWGAFDVLVINKQHPYYDRTIVSGTNYPENGFALSLGRVGSEWEFGDRTSFNDGGLIAIQKNATASGRVEVTLPRIDGAPAYLHDLNNSFDYLLTMDLNEAIHVSDSGYNWDLMGYAYKSDSANASDVPLYRYRSRTNGGHFFTIFWSEVGGGNAQWVYEGIAGYVFPTSKAAPPYMSELKTVYRYRRRFANSYRYTTSMLPGGGYPNWIYEGEAFKIVQDEKPITFSYAGPLPGKNCVLMNEPSDPHAWGDNYLCTHREGLKWSNAGPIADMKCTLINESADPHTWGDNYLCVPHSWPEKITFHSAGNPGGKTCTQLNEPADPHTWNDNFICW